MNRTEKEILKLLHEYENPKRIALSKKYPVFKKPIIALRRLIKNTQHSLDKNLQAKQETIFFSNVLARHQSVLKRRLGSSDQRLQEQKIINLQLACKKLNGLTIEPNKTFSLWKILGKPKKQNGYVNGMLLSNGQVIEGIGGGLCQLSNFLYWIFLHTNVKIIERYHHSMDVFPDSGRTLPFGSGATILYNFVDLKIKNLNPYPLQIKIWLSDKYLKGQILAPQNAKEKFHLLEKNHFFIKRDKKYFRYNEIYRQKKINGKIIKTEKIAVNFAPVLYKVTKKYLTENNFSVLDFTKK